MTDDVRLFVVPRDKYNNLELATVADITKYNTSQSSSSYMRRWADSELADGADESRPRTSSGFLSTGSRIIRVGPYGIVRKQETPKKPVLSHKVVIRRIEKIGKFLDLIIIIMYFIKNHNKISATIIT